MMPSRPLMREFVRHRSNAGLVGRITVAQARTAATRLLDKVAA